MCLFFLNRSQSISYFLLWVECVEMDLAHLLIEVASDMAPESLWFDLTYCDMPFDIIWVYFEWEVSFELIWFQWGHICDDSRVDTVLRVSPPFWEVPCFCACCIQVASKTVGFSPVAPTVKTLAGFDRSWGEHGERTKLHMCLASKDVRAGCLKNPTQAGMAQNEHQNQLKCYQVNTVCKLSAPYFKLQTIKSVVSKSMSRSCQTTH